jgi:outer membrane protein TolC
VKNKILSGLFESSGLLMLLALLPATGLAQENLSLENAVNMALQNNHLLNVKKLQVNEKEQKVNEDKVKYFPSVTIGGSYQYNSNLPALTIEQGRFGQLPFGGVLIPLPAIDEIIEMGNHNIYNAGVSFYQPVLQIGKIGAGVQVSRMELEIARTEQTRAVFQLKQAVEKLYFGLLILEKQIQEAEIKVILAKTKLYDAENALAAGKTTGSGIYGLSAASPQNKILKLECSTMIIRANT